MRRYSEAFKADVRRRMTPPNRQSVSQISAELGHALPVRRIHPHISLDGLAVTTHCSSLSSPLVEKVVKMERRQLCWQRGGTLASISVPITNQE